MRLGVQVFSVPDVPPNTPSDPPLPRLPIADVRDLAPLVVSVRLVWENEARGINPDPKMREILRGAS